MDHLKKATTTRSTGFSPNSHLDLTETEGTLPQKSVFLLQESELPSEKNSRCNPKRSYTLLNPLGGVCRGLSFRNYFYYLCHVQRFSGTIWELL